MALELSEGNITLQLDSNPVHFADFHSYAANTARAIANGGRITQTRGVIASKISSLLGLNFDENTSHPALVVAFGKNNLYTIPSDIGAAHGFQIYGTLTDLDLHSHRFIEDYFEVKLDNLPYL